MTDKDKELCEQVDRLLSVPACGLQPSQSARLLRSLTNRVAELNGELMESKFLADTNYKSWESANERADLAAARIAELSARLEGFAPKVCCGQYDTCTERCHPLVHALREKLQKAERERDELKHRAYEEYWRLRAEAAESALTSARRQGAEEMIRVLHSISLGSQNSSVTKEDLGREARAALNRHLPGASE